MRESYPSPRSGDSPAPPELPPPPPERLQFSLRQLLAYTFGAALLAGVLHYPLREMWQIPGGMWDGKVGLLGFISLGFTAGTLLYCLLRLPVLIVRGGQLRARWRNLREHRRELEGWAKTRAEELNKAAESTPPPGE
ncbi:MAG: hypothetical protein SFU86_05610 [Pirellulaceae bacterium]|nr:hypothetical protein [Pirellulaceae bacterium]